MKKHDFIPHVRAGVYGAGVLLASSLLVFLSNAEWRYFFEKIPFIFNNPLVFFLLPMSLLIDFSKVAIAAYDLIGAEKINLPKIAHLVVELSKSLLITVAILGVLGAIVLPPLVGPILFLSGISVSVAFNAYHVINHAKQWYQAITRDEEKAFKLSTLKSALIFGLSAVLFAGFATLLLSGAGAGVLLGVGLTAAAIFVVGGLSVTYLMYKDEKNEMGRVKKSYKNDSTYKNNLMSMLTSKKALAPNVVEMVLKPSVNDKSVILRRKKHAPQDDMQCLPRRSTQCEGGDDTNEQSSSFHQTYKT